MNFDITSNAVQRGNIKVRTTVVNKGGKEYTEIETSHVGSYLPRKCTCIDPNGEMSILHEYKNGIKIYKEKVNGVWEVIPYDYSERISNPSVYEECSNIVSKTHKTVSKSRTNFIDKAVKYLKNIAKNIKK